MTMRLTTFAAAFAAAAFLAACTTTPDEQTPAPVTDAKPKPGTESKPIARVDVTGKPSGGVDPRLKDPNNILSKRTVLFEFDSFEVKSEYRPLIEAHARYLRENPNAKMLVQGNADERGSREYNVGLGQRRSDSVKKMLLLLGAKEAQIESVSLGEEKPACAEHGEDCWAKNRRGDMLYGGEY
jgi:peptidoglycan-associated lipoprotein